MENLEPNTRLFIVAGKSVDVSSLTMMQRRSLSPIGSHSWFSNASSPSRPVTCSSGVNYTTKMAYILYLLLALVRAKGVVLDRYMMTFGGTIRSAIQLRCTSTRVFIT